MVRAKIQNLHDIEYGITGVLIADFFCIDCADETNVLSQV